MVIPAWFVLRRSGLSLLLVSAVLSQAAFMAASWMLVGMRHKEEVSILPITVLGYSLVIFALAKVAMASTPLILGKLFGHQDFGRR